MGGCEKSKFPTLDERDDSLLQLWNLIKILGTWLLFQRSKIERAGVLRNQSYGRIRFD